MNRIAFLLVVMLSLVGGAKTNRFFTSAVESRYAYGFDGVGPLDDEYYVVTPTGEDAPARMQYVMVDQRGGVWPSNAVATVAQTAATATRLAAAEVAAVAYTNAEAQTQAVVEDLASAIIIVLARVNVSMGRRHI